jgi:hypothetical protein
MSRASMACLFVIEASSHWIKDASDSSLAVPLYFVKLQYPPSSMFSGILKRGCAVRPPGIIEAATPDVAMATAIFLEIVLFQGALYKEMSSQFLQDHQ